MWVDGRVRGEDLTGLLGTKELPILMAGEVLAHRIMSKAHREDHRQSPNDITARSRRSVWIFQGTRLAKKIAMSCYQCQCKDKTLEKQLMGLLPPERLRPLVPFEATALDMFGPFPVKDPAKGCRTFKCWVVAYICLGIKGSMPPALPRIWDRCIHGDTLLVHWDIWTSKPSLLGSCAEHH